MYMASMLKRLANLSDRLVAELEVMLMKEREADMLPVLLVSTMPRLQVLFPEAEAEDKNLRFLTEIIQERIEKHERE